MNRYFTRFQKTIQRVMFPLYIVPLGIEPCERPNGNALLEQFLSRAAAMHKPRVLELGTKQSIAGRSTRHDHFVRNAGEYLGTDIEAGQDVDIVADVHRLTATTGDERFDIIISCSTFEHFKYPHLAAHELMKALRVGGLIFIQTDQCFPIHSYPYDYFRFSREALAGLFGTQMGVDVVATDYEYPARVVSPRHSAVSQISSFLNVRLLGEKRDPTPANYVYELDTASALVCSA